LYKSALFTRREREKRIEESMLEGKNWTAHVEINSCDFFLWLLYGFPSKHINLWDKMQSYKQEKMR
jgi:hypothetical protein